MSIYIHIPFCKTICSYCDFCKVIYFKEWVNKYLDELQKEVKQYYKNEIIKTIYIGGGTPSSLSMEELTKLFSIIKLIKLDKTYEFTFECNIDDLNEEKLELLNDNGVNRLSIGIQSFNQDNLILLNRKHDYNDVKSKIDLANSIGFKNINIDLIYAIPNQTIETLKQDLDLFTSLNITHISTYSLMIEPNTLLGTKKIKSINEEDDYMMYNYIVNYLSNKEFNHYEISNFALNNYESKHNLVYWNNEEYYGFGVGASGFYKNIRYDNTRSLTNYLKGKYRLNENNLSISENIENALMLGFRKIKGINKKDFYNKYNINLEDNAIIKKLVGEGRLIEDSTNIYIDSKYLYVSNNILVNFIGEM